MFLKLGAVVLAGGKSRRMGMPKYRLQLNGVRFLDKLVYELSGFEELLISVEDAGNHPDIRYPMVSDLTPGLGPLGGLYAALKSCASDALVTVPCDVPFFSKAMADCLCRALEGAEDADAVVMSAQDGRIHPLCGIYRKTCLAVLEQCLEQGDYRVRSAAAKLHVNYYQAGKDSWRLDNLNTPQEYEAAQKIYMPPCCFAVCGWKNAGKTTLIQNLIPILIRKGYKTAAVKHDGHSYMPDVPDTDSFRFFQAGADSSIIFDQEKYTVTRRAKLSYEEAAALAYDAGADIILLEGFKWSSYSKIELIRKENGQEPIADLKGRIAFISDQESVHAFTEFSMGLPVFRFEETEKIADFIIKRVANTHKTGGCCLSSFPSVLS